MSVNLTTVASHALQFIAALDSGETPSPQQLTDALSAANNLLFSWFQEQNLTMQELILEQGRLGLAWAVAYSLAAGTYIPPSWAPSSAPQFPDTVTPITLPAGYQRALETSLGIELAPQYDVPVMPALAGIAREARAAVNPVPGKRPVPGQSAESEAPVPGA